MHDKVFEYKNSFVSGQNKETNRCLTSNEEIQALKKVVDEVKRLDSNAQHDMFDGALFELKYLLRTLELSENNIDC